MWPQDDVSTGPAADHHDAVSEMPLNGVKQHISSPVNSMLCTAQVTLVGAGGNEVREGLLLGVGCVPVTPPFGGSQRRHECFGCESGITNVIGSGYRKIPRVLASSKTPGMQRIPVSDQTGRTGRRPTQTSCSSVFLWRCAGCLHSILLQQRR